MLPPCQKSDETYRQYFQEPGILKILIRAKFNQIQPSAVRVGSSESEEAESPAQESPTVPTALGP